MVLFALAKAIPTLLISAWIVAVADAFLAKTTKHGMHGNLGHGCADLKMENNGTFYTTVLQIGTPAQEFAVVVDTGSNSVIVPSCICNEAGYCGNQSSCFRGTNKSSTFSFPGQNDPQSIQAMMITFGSGTIQAIRAMDVVNVGGLTANMTDGILLMTNQALNFGGKFEGILGLGLPEPPTDISIEGNQRQMKIVGRKREDIGNVGEESSIEELMKAIVAANAQEETLEMRTLGIGEDHGPQQDPNDLFHDIIDKLRKKNAEQPQHMKPPQMAHQPKSFLEQAGVDSFSLCFNREDGGMLHMGDSGSTMGEPLKNIGVEHWGLAFHGIGVGDHAHHMSPLFCSSANMSKSQDAPCGVIPDSGTTAIMGPKVQIDQLFESICDNWSRCQKNHTALVEAAEAAKAAATAEYGFSPWEFDTSGTTKSEVLKLLLADCETWMDPHDGIDSDGLPELSFYVRGGDGAKKTLKIPPADYVVSMISEDLEYSTKNIPGFGSIPVGVNHTGNFRKVCLPSISDMEYNTEKHGPVWILGVPLFQRYAVSYNLKQKEISFASLEDGECGTCAKSAHALVSQARSSFRGNQRRHRSRGLRTLRGPPRVPTIDVTRPL